MIKDIEKTMLMYFKTVQERRKLPNRAGLCVSLNWTRDRYFKERESGEYAELLSRFEQKCEDIWIQRLGTNSSTGATFYLKNAFKQDWNDETTIKLTMPTPILGTLKDNDTPEIGQTINVLPHVKD